MAKTSPEPTTDEQPLIGNPREGGRRLKIARLMADMTQQDVQDVTNNVVLKQQVSRIETGIRDKPAAADLGLLCQVYNVTPNEVFEWFEYWHPRESNGETEDERLVHLLSVVKQLPRPMREVLLDTVESAVHMAEANAMQRALERERTEG